VPELPEVETIVRDVRPGLIGRTLISARLSHDDVLRGVNRRKLIRSLKGVRVDAVTRRAKHAVIELDSGYRLVVQPGMTGSLVVHRRPLAPEDARYAVLRVLLDNGRELVYDDVRRLGTLLLLDEKGWRSYDESIGPEPLADDFTPEQLSRVLAGSRQYIKKTLMDQRRLAGVGNIYAQEALFAARIDPSRPSNALTGGETSLLHRELRRILRAAIASNGTTIRDYRTGTGDPGNFQLELLVYGREGQPCRVCGITLTGTHTLDARVTVFCHRCQH
jgi:formamidopyrimidine-DNA glycosylase